MDYTIITLNYLLALQLRGQAHAESVYVLCALKGLIISLACARACRSRLTSGKIGKRALLAKLAAFMLLLDTSFYWLHRLLHLKCFYKFHKLHHAATDPQPRDGIVASSLEIFLTGSLPFFGSVWLTRMHWRVYMYLLAVGLPFVLMAHSFLDKEHTSHHKDQRTNFGNTRVWDYLCGTRFSKHDLHLKSAS